MLILMQQLLLSIFLVIFSATITTYTATNSTTIEVNFIKYQFTLEGMLFSANWNIDNWVWGIVVVTESPIMYVMTLTMKEFVFWR